MHIWNAGGNNRDRRHGRLNVIEVAETEETKRRWKGTFETDVRRFFRIWVTISRKDKQVWY
jgi:hypothetical protein